MESTFTDVTACANTACQRYRKCQHGLAYEALPANRVACRMINPKYLAALEGECPKFLSTDPVLMAKGFMGIVNSIPYSGIHDFNGRMIALYNRKRYYAMRKGDKPIPSEEQSRILAIARQYGATHLEFDEIVEVML